MSGVGKVSVLTGSIKVSEFFSRNVERGPARNRNSDIGKVPVNSVESSRLIERHIQRQVNIKGGYTAEEILVLGKARFKERAIEIQEIKVKIREVRLERDSALVAANLDRIAKEEALHRERSATQRADDATAENKKLKAELQALMKARVDVSEDD